MALRVVSINSLWARPYGGFELLELVFSMADIVPVVIKQYLWSNKLQRDGNTNNIINSHKWIKKWQILHGFYVENLLWNIIQIVGSC